MSLNFLPLLFFCLPRHLPLLFLLHEDENEDDEQDWLQQSRFLQLPALKLQHALTLEHEQLQL